MTVSKDVYQESAAGQWADKPDGTGKWVRYDENGHMVKGWQTTDKGTYYFDLITGAMAKGAGDIDGVPCAFDEYTGIALDGQWLTINGADFWYERAFARAWMAAARKSTTRLPTLGTGWMPLTRARKPPARMSIRNPKLASGLTAPMVPASGSVTMHRAT